MTGWTFGLFNKAVSFWMWDPKSPLVGTAAIDSWGMLLESRTLAGRKRNGLTLSAFGSDIVGAGAGGGVPCEDDEEDSRVLLGRKMQAEGAASGIPAVCIRDEDDESSSPSPNSNLLNNNNCNSNRQCATDFSIAAIMARDSKQQQQQQSTQNQRRNQQTGTGKVHQHGRTLFWATFVGCKNAIRSFDCFFWTIQC